MNACIAKKTSWILCFLLCRKKLYEKPSMIFLIFSLSIKSKSSFNVPICGCKCLIENLTHLATTYFKRRFRPNRDAPSFHSFFPGHPPEPPRPQPDRQEVRPTHGLLQVRKGEQEKEGKITYKLAQQSCQIQQGAKN